MRVALLVSLLLAGCIYDYRVLGGRRDGTGGAGDPGTGGGSGGAMGSGTGGGKPGTGGAGTGGAGTGGVGGAGGRGTGRGGAGAGGVGAAGVGGTGAAGTGGGGAGAGGADIGGGGTGGSAGAGDSDLVLWYTFDEASGPVAADSSSFAGGPRNGTLATAGTAGAIAFSTTHQVGTHAVALTANAATGGGYVAVPGLFDLAPDAVTIAAWVYATGNQDWQRVFDFGSNTTTYMFLTTSEGSDASNFVRFAITIAGNAMEQQITAASALSLNAWHHLAVVLAAGSPYVGDLYIDGVLAGTNPAMTFHAVDLGVTANNYLGKSQFPDPYLNGQLDDFRVYRRALAAAEIATIFGLR